MSVLKIPTSTELADYTQRTAMDGRDYILRFVFNQRLGRWFMDLSDQDGVSIAAGLRLVTNFPIIRHLTDERRPPGELYVIDLSGGGETTDELVTIARDAGLTELGARFELVYFDAEELGREV